MVHSAVRRGRFEERRAVGMHGSKVMTPQLNYKGVIYTLTCCPVLLRLSLGHPPEAELSGGAKLFAVEVKGSFSLTFSKVAR